jgi:hypothetical protein
MWDRILPLVPGIFTCTVLQRLQLKQSAPIHQLSTGAQFNLLAPSHWQLIVTPNRPNWPKCLCAPHEVAADAFVGAREPNTTIARAHPARAR